MVDRGTGSQVSLDLSSRFKPTYRGRQDLYSHCLLRHNVVFINTDEVPCEESRVGDLVQNVGEATLAQQVRNLMSFSFRVCAYYNYRG